MNEMKSNCSDWTAIHDFMPPGPARLTVTGKCTFPTPGYGAKLAKKIPQGINPSILLLEKIVTPPTSPQLDVVTTISVTYEEVTDYRYKQVQISDGSTIEVKDVS
jgi:hypothetical protein